MRTAVRAAAELAQGVQRHQAVERNQHILLAAIQLQDRIDQRLLLVRRLVGQVAGYDGGHVARQDRRYVDRGDGLIQRFELDAGSHRRLKRRGMDR